MKTSPTHWCRAFFRIGSNCDAVDNNTCESLTIISSSFLPVSSMLEAIRCKIMVRIQENRRQKNGLGPSVQAFLRNWRWTSRYILYVMFYGMVKQGMRWKSTKELEIISSLSIWRQEHVLVGSTGSCLDYLVAMPYLLYIVLSKRWIASLLVAFI